MSKQLNGDCRTSSRAEFNSGDDVESSGDEFSVVARNMLIIETRSSEDRKREKLEKCL